MPFPRMTWVGLLVATLGWGFLLAYPLIVSFAGSEGGTQDPARFVPLIGENAVVTGLALAVLGAMGRSLRLLGRIAAGGHTQMQSQFQPQSQPQPRSQVQPPPQMASQPMNHHNGSNGNGHQYAPTFSTPSTNQQAAHEPSPLTQNTPGEVVTRGALNGRDYVLFRDGTVVLETMLGPRRFTSITEAQEFIGVS